jgi:hypothetical protein
VLALLGPPSVPASVAASGHGHQAASRCRREEEWFPARNSPVEAIVPRDLPLFATLGPGKLKNRCNETRRRCGYSNGRAFFLNAVGKARASGALPRIWSWPVI